MILISVCFSLEFDKSPDIKDATQIIVFTRMVFHNCNRSAWPYNFERKDERDRYSQCI